MEWNDNKTRFFFNEVQLIYNVELISAVQQNDSVIYTYILFVMRIILVAQIHQNKKLPILVGGFIN